MGHIFTVAAVMISAYLLGSIPTALIVSRRIKGLDIRRIGDGNMGAHNTFHEIGPKFGVLVAVIDFTKGALAVFLAYRLELGLNWQIVSAAAVILGHDFPIFAGFKGGQGTASTLGTMLVLFPIPTLIGLAVYGLTFLIVKNSNIGCGTGGAVIALILGISQHWLLFLYAVVVFVFIPVKMFIDSPRRRKINLSKQSAPD
jgi:acyl phosphate:glycerol-3-phosphate acyltransferase